ncbi:heparan sulfate glucosamine 3-O-sulfotransferase 6-like [Saccostrea echinata]|uniref:heparan sulfate glucosamine 3-O-sulfotransferase 6-like n=1 Tax=Saccostrea echinata TaxID=191078 RepID=UPI002A7FBA0B|nr:heparan sulfate glucosamine 3-O-sulfotransferase 6-like [Saccostrea echinata]
MLGVMASKTIRKIRRKSWCTFISGLCSLVLLCLFSFNNQHLFRETWDSKKNPSSKFYSRPLEMGYHYRNLQNVIHYGNVSQIQSGVISEGTLFKEQLKHDDPRRSKTLTEEAKVSGKTDKLYSMDMEKERKRRLPQAIIIGVKKGGTRALLEFLRVHPDVQATGPEPHFFDKHYHKGLEWYRMLMPETMPNQLTIEKTPSYFVTKEVPSRIFKMSNSTKLLLVVRDPVTRAISDYTQILSKHGGKIKSFQSSAFLNNDTTKINTSWIVIRIGLYVKHLENWLSVFPSEQIHFVHGENLVTNPGEEMKKVQNFLGLKQFITEQHFLINKSRGFPCIKKKITNKRGHCLDETKGRKHPKLPADVISSLKRFYRPYNEKFYQVTNINFNWI